MKSQVYLNTFTTNKQVPESLEDIYMVRYMPEATSDGPIARASAHSRHPTSFILLQLNDSIFSFINHPQALAFLRILDQQSFQRMDFWLLVDGMTDALLQLREVNV